jgi:hypothetical protein
MRRVKYMSDFIFGGKPFGCLRKVDAAVVKLEIESKSVVPPSLWEDLGQEVYQNIIHEILRIEHILGSHSITT